MDGGGDLDFDAQPASASSAHSMTIGSVVRD